MASSASAIASEQPADEAAVLRVLAEYLDRVDHHDAGTAADLFVRDGKLELGALALVGRDAIAEFLERRSSDQQATGRTTRHLSGPPAVRFAGAGRASARSSAAVFAGAGPMPLASAPPSTICDFVDELERGADGRWRFLSRRADIIFVGEGAAGFARSEPRTTGE